MMGRSSKWVQVRVVSSAVGRSWPYAGHDGPCVLALECGHFVRGQPSDIAFLLKRGHVDCNLCREERLAKEAAEAPKPEPKPPAPPAADPQVAAVVQQTATTVEKLSAVVQRLLDRQTALEDALTKPAPVAEPPPEA